MPFACRLSFCGNATLNLSVILTSHLDLSRSRRKKRAITYSKTRLVIVANPIWRFTLNRYYFSFHKDIDECKNSDICGPNEKCINQPATYKCSCNNGFESEDEDKLDCTGKHRRHSHNLLKYKLLNAFMSTLSC